MDVRESLNRNRNPLVQRVLLPYLTFFFIIGNDFLQESNKTRPLYIKIYLWAAKTIYFIQRITSIIMILLTFTNSTMTIGSVSLLSSVTAAVLNSLVGHMVLFIKSVQVNNILDELHDISTQIMGHNSKLHKKVVIFQRCSLIIIFLFVMMLVHSFYQKPLRRELDNWIFKNRSASQNENNSTAYYINLTYSVFQLSAIVSLLFFVGFFSVLTFYVQVSFECLRQKYLNDIREFNNGSSSSSSTRRPTTTLDKITVWITDNPEDENERRLQSSEHPVWALLRCHQALSQLIILIDKTFREALMIWSFCEITSVVFIIRALNIGLPPTEEKPRYFNLLAAILTTAIMFFTKALHTGTINDQVGCLVRLGFTVVLLHFGEGSAQVTSG